MNALPDFFLKLFNSSDWPQAWNRGKWNDAHTRIYIPRPLVIPAALFTLYLLVINGDSGVNKTTPNKLFYAFTIFNITGGITYLLSAQSFFRFNTISILLTGAAGLVVISRIIKLYPQLLSRGFKKRLNGAKTQLGKIANIYKAYFLLYTTIIIKAYINE